ncbi:MAG TPA: hypothetical protein VEK39_12075 [Solirubrobacterales bacterium]|nr:hypothetical protein [Solirubrobacterales bacterium]
MRAVNLIPPEERRGRVPTGTSAVSYLVVGVLLAILAGVTALVLTNNQISNSQADVAQLERERTEAQARAASLQSFADFRSMQEERTTTVASLAQSRFDWERVLRELALVLPSDVWLIGLEGTVSPDVELEGGADVAIRDEVPGPALELVGCTVDQEGVGRLAAALGDIDGVTRVSVAHSSRPELEESDTGGSDQGSEEDCRTHDFITQFEIVAAFDEVPAPAGAAPGTTTPATPTAPTSTGDDVTEGSTASQDAAQQGVQEGQEAADLAPGG